MKDVLRRTGTARFLATPEKTRTCTLPSHIRRKKVPTTLVCYSVALLSGSRQSNIICLKPVGSGNYS